MIRLIGAASGWGAQLRECEEGPEFLRKSKLREALCKENLEISEWRILFPSIKASQKQIGLADSLPLIAEFNRALAREVEAALAAGDMPVVLGGDHSIAVGTWNGAYQFCARGDQLPLGLVWIDAHMDGHVPETSPSGAWHGMPVAGLLGHGRPEMARLLQEAPVLDPSHLCMIGIRSYEEGEAKLLREMNVRIYFMEEVARRGFSAVLEEVLEHMNKTVPSYGVSLDLDVVDPFDAPGVGSPERGGISAKDLLSGIRQLHGQIKMKAFEIAELNPSRDINRKTSNLCASILLKVLQHE
jgi:arginase